MTILYVLLRPLLSITAIWSLSFMDFMHYLREISAYPQCEMSGSSQTWNCSGKWWCLQSECLSNYTRWDAADFMIEAKIFLQPRSQCLIWSLTKGCMCSFRTTSRPQMSMMSLRFFSKPSPPTSRTWSSLTRATRPGGAPCCPTPRRSSLCAMSSTKEPTSTKS